MTILHRGAHERAETPADGRAPPPRPLRRRRPRAAGSTGRTYDLVVAMYGRLRRIAELTAGSGRPLRLGRRRARPPGLDEPVALRARRLPVPMARTAPTVDDPAEDEKGYRVARTEEAVFAHHPTRRPLPLPVRLRAVPARAPGVVDRAPRPRRSPPDRGGRRRPHAAPPRLHGEPRARRAARPSTSPRPRPGRCSTPATRRCCRSARSSSSSRAALGHELELVSMPYDLAVPARPLLAQPLPTHRVLDLPAAHDARLPRRGPGPRGGGPHRSLAGRAPARARRGRRRWCSPTPSTTRPRTR